MLRVRGCVQSQKGCEQQLLLRLRSCATNPKQPAIDLARLLLRGARGAAAYIYARLQQHLSMRAAPGFLAPVKDSSVAVCARAPFDQQRAKHTPPLHTLLTKSPPNCHVPRPWPPRPLAFSSPVLQGSAAVVTTATVRPGVRRLLSGLVLPLVLRLRRHDDWRAPSAPPAELSRRLEDLPRKNPVMNVAVVWMSRTRPMVLEIANWLCSTGLGARGGGSQAPPPRKDHIPVGRFMMGMDASSKEGGLKRISVCRNRRFSFSFISYEPAFLAYTS